MTVGSLLTLYGNSYSVVRSTLIMTTAQGRICQRNAGNKIKETKHIQVSKGC